MRTILQFGLSLLLMGLVQMGLVQGASADDMTQIKKELATLLPGVSIDSVQPSPIANIYEVTIGDRLVYVTADGKYLFMGDLIDLVKQENVSAAKHVKAILKLVNAVGENNMMIMGPKTPKHIITVFTDVDCPYCAKLHQEIPTLNKEGVQVRYLFYPRTGLSSPSYWHAVAVWCAKDRLQAFGVANTGGKLEMKTCDNPVAVHYELGERIHIQGTPAIILENGQIVPGYVPAAKLLEMLNS